MVLKEAFLRHEYVTPHCAALRYYFELKALKKKVQNHSDLHSASLKPEFQFSTCKVSLYPSKTVVMSAQRGTCGWGGCQYRGTSLPVTVPAQGLVFVTLPGSLAFVNLLCDVRLTLGGVFLSYSLSGSCKLCLSNASALHRQRAACLRQCDSQGQSRSGNSEREGGGGARGAHLSSQPEAPEFKVILVYMSAWGQPELCEIKS